MAINPDDLRDYTWEEIQKAAKQAMVTGVFTQSISEPGRTIAFGSVENAMRLHDYATKQLELASQKRGGRGRLRARWN